MCLSAPWGGDKPHPFAHMATIKAIRSKHLEAVVLQGSLHGDDQRRQPVPGHGSPQLVSQAVHAGSSSAVRLYKNWVKQ